MQPRSSMSPIPQSIRPPAVPRVDPSLPVHSAAISQTNQFEYSTTPFAQSEKSQEYGDDLSLSKQMVGRAKNIDHTSSVFSPGRTKMRSLINHLWNVGAPMWRCIAILCLSTHKTILPAKKDQEFRCDKTCHKACQFEVPPVVHFRKFKF